MKERPILFSAPMVIAILAGEKTQTRRVFNERTMKLMRAAAALGEVSWFMDEGRLAKNDLPYIQQFSPYGQPGDRLWVREAWRTVAGANDIPPRDLMNVERFTHYEADEAKPAGIGKLRPSMFMPRWASRISLEIAGVRVERLNDISEADSISEGAQWAACGAPQDGSHKAGYAQLCEQINGSGAWAANPWVWAIDFKRVDHG